MSFERIKSIVLMILVLTSGYLTWQIWTYQPTYENSDQSEYFKVASDIKTIADVVKPKSVLLHVGERHYQLNGETEMNNIQQAFSKWSIYSLEDISHQVNEVEFLTFIHSKSNTEINFTDQIPFKLYKSVFNVEMNEIPEFSFDKIIFNSSNSNLEEAKMYFISTENRTIIQTIVNGESIRRFYGMYYKNADEYPEYVKYQVNKRKDIYLLKDPPSMDQFSYQLGYMNINTFKNALFSDPTSVRHEYDSDVEEFTDGTRLLSVDRDSAMINFINPSQKKEAFSSTSDLLQQSINSVNDHAGWDKRTGGKSPFRLSGISQEEQRVIFRLFVNGLPVFNEEGMAEIELVWGNEEIYQYQRPYFYLEFAYPYPSKFKLLPSGEEVIEALKNVKNLNPEAIEDLEIGYRMTTINSKSVNLVPTWYYRYAGTWIILPFEHEGEDR
ncbi:YycH family regulatory protein [Bacillus cihuensis]|uniref:YycH family regulatory protein n=1 Tax=Bacillus cihuensis TaxID=1208599 RepID=UPI0003FB1574|nr:two-component system activity regulator YycH [Bacillus cihuensis]